MKNLFYGFLITIIAVVAFSLVIFSRYAVYKYMLEPKIQQTVEKVLLEKGLIER